MKKFSCSRFLNFSKRTFTDSFKNNKNDFQGAGKLGDKKDRQQDKEESPSMFAGLGDKLKDISHKVTDTISSAAEKVGIKSHSIDSSSQSNQGQSFSSFGQSNKTETNQSKFKDSSKEGTSWNSNLYGQKTDFTQSGKTGSFSQTGKTDNFSQSGKSDFYTTPKSDSAGTAQYSSRPSGEYGQSGGISEKGQSYPFKGSTGGTQGGVYGGTGHSGGAYGGTSDRPRAEGTSGSSADFEFGQHGSAGGTPVGGASTKSTGSNTTGVGTTSTKK